MNKVNLSTDCVIVFDGKVLMLKRSISPYESYWVLPGGHVESNEKVEDALKREVMEETNIRISDDFKIINVYSDPERDPRGRTISCAYFFKIFDIDSIELNNESDKFKFYDFNNLPEKVGFDHKKIIEDAYDKFLK